MDTLDCLDEGKNVPSRYGNYLTFIKLIQTAKIMRPIDQKAASVTFGVELETIVPFSAMLQVGSYHAGRPIVSAVGTEGTRLEAPGFQGRRWHADRDASIRPASSLTMGAELVSPILHGEEGVQNLVDFIAWANAIGAKVNDSCGCHITIGVDSIIGTSSIQARAEFARKLAHIAQWHARSIYGQTGTGRHLNRYSHTFAADVADLVRRMETAPDLRAKGEAAVQCGRGMINFRKLFTHGVVEFRAFAGTTNAQKVMHHLATAIGLCRRAHEVKRLGGFKKNKLQAKRTQSATDALHFLWDYLGWTGDKRDVALGLFGRLHSDFAEYSPEAVRLCRRFDERYPTASL